MTVFNTTVIDCFDDEYRFLSNFWGSHIVYNDVSYPTVEHAYQAAKAANPIDALSILHMRTPGAAKRMGRHITMKDDWEQIKLQVMLDCLRLKFQEPYIRYQLIQTGDAILIEGNNWHDTFWGQCGGVGKNWLGRLLMMVRSEVQQAFRQQPV